MSFSALTGFEQRCIKPAFKRGLPTIAGAALIASATLEAASAQATPTFFFDTPGVTPMSSSQGITTLTTNSAGNFTLSIWYTFQPTVSTTYYGIDLFVGFDQANQSGASATAQNGTVVLGSGLNSSTAVTNVNTLLFTDIGNQLGGGADPSSSPTPSSAIRPYGLDIDLAGVAGFAAPGATPVHLADLTLNDAALAAGMNQSIEIYSNDPAGDASAFTTYVADGSGDPSSYARPAESYILNLVQGASASAMPEPSSLVLAFSPIALLVRRRKRQNVTKKQ